MRGPGYLSPGVRRQAIQRCDDSRGVEIVNWDRGSRLWRHTERMFAPAVGVASVVLGALLLTFTAVLAWGTHLGEARRSAPIEDDLDRDPSRAGISVSTRSST
jgi:hypothetical protein